jgi:flavin reductase (DIM6/NTAB) family NADH-FMN oxidoreductase RutF
MAKDAWVCGTQSGKSVDKFAKTGFTPVESLRVKPPTIKESTVAFECRVSKQVQSGDHTIFIANVVGIQGNPENTSHLRSIHYNKLIAMDFEGNINWNLKHK